MKINHQTPAVIAECTYLLDTVGYCVLPSYLDDEYCDFLSQRLEYAIGKYSPIEGVERSAQDRYHLHDLLCRDLAFAKLLEDRNLDALLAPHLGPYWILYAFTSSSLPPHGENYGSRIHVDSPRLIQGYPTNMGVIWTLTEFTSANGGTQLLPASHHSEAVPDSVFFERNSITLECPRGSLVLFNARVFHRAGSNSTDQFRHSLTMNACRSYMKQRMDWVRFIPSDISDQLDNQARRIVGFDTRIPTTLGEFFVPEDKRLYKSGQG